MDEQLIEEYKELQNRVVDFNFKYNQNISLQNSNELLDKKLDNLNTSLNSNVNYYMNAITKEVNDLQKLQYDTVKSITKYLDIKFEQSNKYKISGNTVLKPNNLVINIDSNIYFINYEDSNKLYIYDKFNNQCNPLTKLSDINIKSMLRYGKSILAIENNTKELFYIDLNTNKSRTLLNRCLDFICDEDKIYCINDNKLSILKCYDFSICAEYQLINLSFLQDIELKRRIEEKSSIEKIGDYLFINYGEVNYIIDLKKNIIVYKNNI